MHLGVEQVCYVVGTFIQCPAQPNLVIAKFFYTVLAVRKNNSLVLAINANWNAMQFVAT